MMVAAITAKTGKYVNTFFADFEVCIVNSINNSFGGPEKMEGILRNPTVS